MDANIETADIYGRLDVTIPEAVYEAGKVSTVSLLLRNPFDRPVDILEIQGPRSSHLSEIAREARTAEDKNPLSPLQQTRKEIGWFRSLLQGLYKEVEFTGVSVGGISVEFPRTKSSFNISAEPNSEIEVDTDLSNYDSVNVSAQEGAKVRFTPQIHAQAPFENKAITIEPHCEAVAYFQISTVGWLFFTPTRRSLSTQIRYRINGKEKTQVTTSEFDVRPPLRAMVIGSVAGAILGTLAKVLNTAQALQWQAIAVSIGASVVMSLIATVALSRKTGAQGFITVEDFFGGFVVGALIGYGGSTYFERAIIPKTPTS
jgi:hypothetical protein